MPLALNANVLDLNCVCEMKMRDSFSSWSGGATWFALGYGDEIRDTNTPPLRLPNV